MPQMIGVIFVSKRNVGFFPRWAIGTIFYSIVLLNVYAFFFFSGDFQGFILGGTLVLFLSFVAGFLEGVSRYKHDN